MTIKGLDVDLSYAAAMRTGGGMNCRYTRQLEFFGGARELCQRSC